MGLSHKEHISFDKKALEKFLTLKEKADEIFSIENPVANKGAILMEEMDALSADIIANYLDKSFEVINMEAEAGSSMPDSSERKWTLS